MSRGVDGLTAEERRWYSLEGMASGIYDRHAATLEKQGTHVPKWGWLTEAQRETWRALAREREQAGWNSMDGFEEEAT